MHLALFTLLAASSLAAGNVCITPGCVHAASKILTNIDKKTDPCDNFFQYACGNFVDNTIIPDDKPSVSTYGLTRDLVQDQLHLVLEKKHRNYQLRPFRLVKAMYGACLDTKNIERHGLRPLHAVLERLGGWPVALGEAWSKNSFCWTEQIALIRSVGYGTGYIVDVSVAPNNLDTKRYQIDLDQSHTGLSREYLVKGLDNDVVQAYRDYMVNMAVLLGADRLTAESEMEDSLLLEMELAEISVPREQRRNATLLNNPMSVAELQRRYPYLEWLDYLRGVLQQNLDESTVVNVNVPSFFADLDAVLRKTSRRTIANYLAWRVVQQSAPYLGKTVRDIQQDYFSVMSGQTSRSYRWKECVQMVSKTLNLAVGSMYVREYFKENAKRETMEMVSYIKAVFKKALIHLDWMDTDTKKHALKKLHAMHAHIAYPDELLNDQKITDYYSTLQVNQNRYLESILNITLFNFNEAHGLLYQQVNKTDWKFHGAAAVVNAFYSPTQNSIQFPAGIFQGMFFSIDRPRYLNYGCIGFTIGHEITHGFDDHGRQFDLDGNLVNWWALDTQRSFEHRAKCIVDQYNSYVAPGTNLHVNGINTQGENIADTGGVKYAYYAYKNWVRDNGPEPRLPGIELNQRQMFWLAAANKWCSVYKSQSLKLMVLTDPHAPAVYRINGPFSNLPEFAADYHCPIGSGMNPAKKCTLW